ncbi:12-oxo-phytodienoic acid-like protein [Cunninghamella echinulata]|nr:12-oxo-phytodienoic acid-like protein [Cunninghamella echinulata]
MTTSTTPILFTPIRLGKLLLKHRIAMAPLTRHRCDENGVPTDLVVKHYEQRATEGGLLISEATGISNNAGHYPYTPGIFTEKQIEGWQKVTSAVHQKKGIIYLQLWHLGRTTHSFLLPSNQQVVSASPIRIVGDPLSPLDLPYETPRALTIDEILSITQDYAKAAKNAIIAGFDGVELHSSIGYLLDQFICTSSNQRTDQYGGLIENRVRFTLEVVDAIVEAIGAERTAVRFSPFNSYQDMHDDTPIETWSYLTQQLQKNHPNLAYLHFVEPRDIDDDDEGEDKNKDKEEQHGNKNNKTKEKEKDDDDSKNWSLDPFRTIWKGPFIVAGGYTHDYKLAYETTEMHSNTIVAFGRAFIANSDLVYRIQHHLPFNKYDRSTFYTPCTGKGYNDYPLFSQPMK